MKTSDQGRAALELEEGVVLRAYRDVAGIWTIGAGLTAASGVVKPQAGMVITREEADLLLERALGRYEAEVDRAMFFDNVDGVHLIQHAFDAGVSFHFNTGAIGRANWVRLWKTGAPGRAIADALLAWSKAGGKVLPALEARRKREYAMLMHGTYRVPAPQEKAHPVFARWGLSMQYSETKAVFDGLRKLGYEPGPGTDRVSLSAVQAFQKDHGLTVDGIIGRATLSTLQRVLDAPQKAKTPTVLLVAGALSDLAMSQSSLPLVVAGSAALWLGYAAWSYRDVVAAKITPAFPRVAAYLRSL